MDEFTTGEALDVRFYAGAFDNAVDLVVGRALEGRGGYAVLCSVHVLMTPRREPLLRSALDEAWAVFPDGVPIAWLLKRSGAPATERVCGIDLMPAVIERGIAHGLRHYLLGSTPEVLAKLERNLLERYPGIELAGSLGARRSSMLLRPGSERRSRTSFGAPLARQSRSSGCIGTRPLWRRRWCWESAPHSIFMRARRSGRLSGCSERGSSGCTDSVANRAGCSSVI